MKKIFIALMLLSCITTYSQLKDLVNPFRVITVSPNYQNVYPRYSTLQNAYTSIKDSANGTTGKYFIINVVTNTGNITDFTSGWQDSILNRFPYMQLAIFGQGAQDTITGVNTDQFTLISGILNLKNSLAGDGILFDGSSFSILPQNYLGSALYLDGDSLKLRLFPPLYFTPNFAGLKKMFHSGLQVHPDSGAIRVLPLAPLSINRDTTKILYLPPFTLQNDSFALNYNTDQFYVVSNASPMFNLKIDSGLVSNSGGLSVKTDGLRLGINSNKKLTIKDKVAGTGLYWDGDSLNLGISLLIYTDVDNKTLLFNYNTNQFRINGQSSNTFCINVDSGLYAGTNNSPQAIRIKTDNVELGFNSSSQLETRSTLWGDGLYKSGDSGNVMVSEFMKVENDTVKAKTSYTIVMYGDSLTTNVTSTGRGILPYDSTGVPILYTGKIKRITYTYQLSSGNDTVIADNQNTSVTFGDKIRGSWNNGGSKYNIQKWSQSSRTWSTSIQLNFGGFTNKPYRIIIELYAEAQ